MLQNLSHKYHWLILTLIVSLFLGLAVTTLSSDHHHLVFLGFKLPQLCLLGQLFELGCPLCGLTRSLWCCVHGHWLGAFHYNPLGPLLFLGFAFQIPWRIYLIFFHKKETPTEQFDSKLCGFFFYLALARWIYLILLTFLLQITTVPTFTGEFNVSA